MLSELGIFQGEINNFFDDELAKTLSELRSGYGLSEEPRIDEDLFALLARLYEEKNVETPVVEEIQNEEDLIIVVNLSETLLYLLENGEEVAKFPVSIGKSDSPSPIGAWKIVNMGAKKGAAFGTRWMGLNVPWGVYGIHGTNNPGSIGTGASGGCVRLYNRHVEKLFSMVTHGTRVYIIEEPFGYLNRVQRRMVMGSQGSGVFAVQNRLRQLGYYDKKADGFYGWWTHKAVQKFQEDNGWEVTGRLDAYQIQQMGLFPFE